MTFKLYVRPSDLFFPEGQLFSDWMDIRDWILAGVIMPYKNNKKSKCLNATLVNYFAVPDQTILSFRWEVTVPWGYAKGLMLSLRAIHMTPAQAEAKQLHNTGNVLSREVCSIDLNTIQIIPEFTNTPLPLPFWPLIISNKPLTKHDYDVAAKNFVLALMHAMVVHKVIVAFHHFITYTN